MGSARILISLYVVCIFIVAGVFIIGCTHFECFYGKNVEVREFYTFPYKGPGSNIVFVRQYEFYRDPKGIMQVPDGGTEKYLYRNVAMYSLDTLSGKVRKITDLEGYFQRWPHDVRISWKGDKIVYSGGLRYHRDGKPIRGIFAVNSDGNNKYQLVQEGESNDISPDGKNTIYLKHKEDNSTELWKMTIEGKDHQLLRTFPSRLGSAKWKNNDYILVELSPNSYDPGEVTLLDISTKQLVVSPDTYNRFDYGRVSLGDIQDQYEYGDEITREDEDVYGGIEETRVLKGYVQNTSYDEWGVPSPPKTVFFPF